jgi:heptosyltransferase-1
MRILIVKLSSIGDVVHTLPAAALLRRELPNARIAWAVERRAAAILEDSPAIDELIKLDLRGWRKRLLARSTLDDASARVSELRQARELNGARRADVAIDFQGLMKSGLVAFATRASRRIGFETQELREKPSKFFLTEQVDTSQLKHVIDKNLELARTVLRSESTVPQTVNNGYEFPIAVSSDDERYAEAVIKSREGFAIVNNGGGWPTKLWPSERYAELADWLWSECAIRSFVTYGPGEEALARSVVESSKSGAVEAVASTLKQFVALARRAALFVGSDTGPLHLAAACKTPIVGLYGPTSPERNGPFDPRDVTVGRKLWCRADCHRRSCWHWECMNIPVAEVKRAVLQRLTTAKETSAK